MKWLQIHKYWKSSPLLLLLLVIVTEMGFRKIDPYRNLPPAATELRNSAFKNGWPEYVRAASDKEQPLSLLISNSQGYGVEMKDPNDIYFAGLKDLEAKEHPSQQWENWSLSGLRTADLELLTVQATVREADEIVFVLNFGNFDQHYNINLDYGNTDLNLLIGNPFFWPKTERTLVRPSIDRDERIAKTMERYLSAIRYRLPLYQRLSPFVADEDEVFFFGNPVNRARNVNVQEIPNFRKYIGKYRRQFRHKLTQKELDLRMDTFEQFWTLFAERTQDQSVKVTVVWGPLSSEHIKDYDFEQVRKFNQSATVYLQNMGYRVIDLTDSMDSSNFLSRGHFTKEGHARFSKNLHERLSDEL